MEKIHPNLPEPYCYEHDYRKIPREYLNPHIPQGRGMVKWQAFKTLPEQYEQLEQYIQDQNKIDMPILSDEQVQILNEKLNMKIHYNALANVEYYSDGYMYSIQGYIKKIDVIESMLIITNDKGNEVKEIPLTSIINLD
ncbi:MULTISPECIES: YolD-like family protein [Staphylococcus]|uniref:YolD-like family protein n=1 Tax=Staphylococcus TaxID=1279 RepID=UPI00119EC76B|nr:MULTISPECIES: YolD-like family protein [Staphylococcus]MDV3053640.1 YolD-like family protein [Staphylococcus ureilyticus]